MLPTNRHLQSPPHVSLVSGNCPYRIVKPNVQSMHVRSTARFKTPTWPLVCHCCKELPERVHGRRALTAGVAWMPVWLASARKRTQPSLCPSQSTTEPLYRWTSQRCSEAGKKGKGARNVPGTVFRFSGPPLWTKCTFQSQPRYGSVGPGFITK